MKTPEDYIAEVRQAQEEVYRRNYPNLPVPTYKLMKGSKFIKVIETDMGSERVHCFIDYEGNLYKAASWKAPAKGIRGNINNEKKPLLCGQFYR
ncbi:MAG TPA: hypothetical protein VK172_10560 [Lentimicrobium sp.]|nr:hypothetical protein [Lentimicrobium sp.]